MVKIYSISTCPWCTKVKKYLNSKKISFEELNVEDDMEARNEMINKSKQMSVPVLDIDGSIIVGFDKDAIDSLIDSQTDAKIE